MNLLKVITMGAAGLLFSAGASAVLISDVGGYDNLLNSTFQGSAELPNSGEGAEEDWIETFLGIDITYTQLDESVSDGASWEAVTGTGALDGDYAFNFGVDYTPDYFLVKVGSGAGAGADGSHFLFSNNSSFNWAFINLSMLGDGVSLTNIDIISHVGRTGGTVTVPEPGTMALLGLGLVGLGLSRRRKAKA